MTADVLTDSLRSDVELLWDYHDLHHELRSVDVGIGLGSHDPGIVVFIYRERAIELGVPSEAISVEPAATNIGQNIDFTRWLLADEGIDVNSILLISRPYHLSVYFDRLIEGRPILRQFTVTPGGPHIDLMS